MITKELIIGTGESLAFDVVPLAVGMTRNDACVYLVMRQSSGESYELLYVGITCRQKRRFRKHHLEDQFCRYGADSLGILPVQDYRNRRSLEIELKSLYNPPCNDGKSFVQMFEDGKEIVHRGRVI